MGRMKGGGKRKWKGVNDMRRLGGIQAALGEMKPN